jgi:lipopolysaccharide export system protein LptA
MMVFLGFRFRVARAAGRLILAAALLASIASPASADTFRFTADRMESVVAEGRERALLAGNARLIADSLEISADTIELSGKNWRFARCSGRVVAEDKEQGIRITTERLTYDRETKVSRLDGESVLEDSRNHVVLKAFWMENDDGRKLVSARVGVRVFKDKTQARSASLVYRRDEQLLELLGAAKVLRDGDEYKAERILLDLETDEITLSGGVSGTVVKKESEKPADAAFEAENPPAASGTAPETPAQPEEASP